MADSTQTNLPQVIANLMAYVSLYLDNHPDGFKEYELITHLSDDNYFHGNFRSPSLNTPSQNLDLFQKHFLLFHILYLIDDQMLANKTGTVSITPLLIKKLSHTEGLSSLDKPNTLREYYLNLHNLEETTDDNVNDLLNSFWQYYLRNDKRKDALSTLGSVDPVDDMAIKTAYRRLANTVHPDKGGETDKIQKVNQAYALLVKNQA